VRVTVLRGDAITLAIDASRIDLSRFAGEVYGQEKCGGERAIVADLDDDRGRAAR